MDPITGLLIATWIAGYFTRNTVQDLAFKARGEDPPSYRREQERLARKATRRPVTERREARRFWVNAWEDAWEGAEERRARRHQDKAGQRREAWELEDQVAKAEDQAHQRNAEIDQAEDQAHDRNAGLAACERCSAPTPEAALVPRHHDREFVLVCAACADRIDMDAPERAEAAHTGDHSDQGDDQGDPDDKEADTTSTDEGESADEGAFQLADPAPDGAAHDQHDHRPDATVIRPAAWGQQDASPAPQHTTQQEVEAVSETHSLNAALTYTTQMSGQATQGVTSVETSIASLTAGGVSGPAIAALQAAQEALQTAAAQFQTAHAALQRHIQVQEAYEANRDAGTRQFVTSD